nr:MAG TPA: hypothetical protein [Crassvirales sp.]
MDNHTSWSINSMDLSGTHHIPGNNIPLDTTPAYCLTPNLQY